MSESEKFVVIVAGGQGIRMGSVIPKQFLPLLGKPMLCHAIETFAHAIPGINIILVLPHDQVGSAQTVLRSYIGSIEVTTVAGGETRYHSVQNGLKEVGNNGIVFIHDGARPLISKELILRCYDQAVEKGSAIPVVPLVESARIVNGDISRPVDRDNLRIVQTPQTFRTNIILPAFKQEYSPSFTDEATVLEALGIPVHLVDGRPDNIKVTTPNDMIVAEALLNARINEQISA